jgi:putative DNA primase/helicase
VTAKERPATASRPDPRVPDSSVNGEAPAGKYLDQIDQATQSGNSSVETDARASATVDDAPFPQTAGESRRIAWNLLAFLRTDTGNGQRLCAEFGTELLYCDDWKHWRYWDGSRWARDAELNVLKAAVKTVRSYQKAAVHCESHPTYGPKREEYMKHSFASESRAQLNAMVSQARIYLAVTPEHFDCNSWLLNVRNGTLNLRTGKLHPHNREDFITKLAPADYDPTAQCPLWLKFLDRIMGGKEDETEEEAKAKEGMIAFLQRAAGYCLTGDISEQALFIPYGEGANGKSTFLNAIKYVMGGDYAKEAPTELLVAKRSGGISNDSADLKGLRFVTSIETGERRQLNETLVKQLTGGDEVTARRLYENNATFTPECKIWLATNHKPIIRGTDYGIKRRIRLIPFTVKIPEREWDKSLSKKLEREASGILRC